MNKIGRVKYTSRSIFDGFQKPHFRECGIITDFDRDRPHIHLFHLDNNSCFRMPSHVPLIASQILQQECPGLKLYDVDLSYTTGHCHTDIDFITTNEWISGMKVSNPLVFLIGFGRSLEEYQKILDSPEGFMQALNEKAPVFEGAPNYYYIVPLPGHPEKYHTFDSSRRVGNRQKIVLANSRKLKSYMQDEEAAYLSFSNDTTEFISFIRPWKGYPEELPYASYQQENHRLGFVNGWYRTYNLLCLGAPFVPLIMDDTKMTREFERRAGVASNHKSLICLTPHKPSELKP